MVNEGGLEIVITEIVITVEDNDVLKIKVAVNEYGVAHPLAVSTLMSFLDGQKVAADAAEKILRNKSA